MSFQVNSDTLEISFGNVNELVKEVHPFHEGQYPLFKKFGFSTVGQVVETWVPSDEWRSLPDIDKWKYVALCSLFWLKEYQRRDDNKRQEDRHLIAKLCKLEKESRQLQEDLWRLKL